MYVVCRMGRHYTDNLDELDEYVTRKKKQDIEVAIENLKFTLPERALNREVLIDIFDTKGKTIEVLAYPAINPKKLRVKDEVPENVEYLIIVEHPMDNIEVKEGTYIMPVLSKEITKIERKDERLYILEVFKERFLKRLKRIRKDVKVGIYSENLYYLYSSFLKKEGYNVFEKPLTKKNLKEFFK